MEMVMANGFSEMSANEMDELNGGSLGECVSVTAGAGICGAVGRKVGIAVGGTAGGPVGAAVGAIVGTAAGYGIYHLADYFF